MIELPSILIRKRFTSKDEFISKAEEVFTHDFIEYPPKLNGVYVGCRQDKMPNNGYNRTFWHLISEGDHREEDKVDEDRVERIPWINPIIEGQPDADWMMWEKPAKRNNSRILIYSCKYKYLVVIEKRKGRDIVFWTAFPIGVDNNHYERKLIKEHKKYVS